jgi:hypothetical protein
MFQHDRREQEKMKTGSNRKILILVIATLAAFCLISPHKTEAAIAVDAVSTNTGTGASLTISHTASGTNRLMLVAPQWNAGGSQVKVVTGVTYNGVPLTLVQHAEQSDDAATDIWMLVNPPTGGPYNVVVTYDLAPAFEHIAGVITFTGVDQTTPLGTPNWNSETRAGTLEPASVAVSSLPGELVFATVASETPDFPGVTWQGGTPEHWNIGVGGTGPYNTVGAAATEPGAATVTMTWANVNDHWAAAGVSIKPAATNNPPSAPQTPWCEGTTNPTGITDLTPEFSAVYDDPDTSDTAEYYEIEVDTSSSFNGTRMWDTGKTPLTSLAENTRMPDVSYAGTPLSEDGSTYYWRIRFWDNSDAQGAWIVQPFTMYAPGTVKVWVSQSDDDAEENKNDGSVSRSSTDLELAYEGGTVAQWIGMRFQNIAVPQGATITNAYVQFTADVTNSEATDLTIYGQDINDAPEFTSAQYNISSRTRTSATVSWSPPAWNTAGEQDVAQRTPNISSIIQEIVDRTADGGWQSGNDLVIIIDGTGEREAESWNGATNDHGNLSLAPYIHIEYSVVPPTTVYRSIGTSTADLKTGTPNIDISSGTGTFSVEQTGNIGIGNHLQWQHHCVHNRKDG